MDPVFSTTSSIASELLSSHHIATKRYSKYLNSLISTPGGDSDLDTLMNGLIKKKLKIIPNNVEWRMQSDPVFTAMEGDFMKPRIKEVDELLVKGVDVTVYTGQLKWEGLKTLLAIDRTPIYCGKEKITKDFIKSYRNLHFYWILGAGHFVFSVYSVN
ncbi:hypothetical protein OROHE_012253 [Orobanche hederae]